MEKELKILLSLEMAKKWYKSEDAELRTLALSVYTKEELEELTIEDIMTNVQDKYPELWDKMSSMNYITIVAKYFNGDWEKRDDTIGYFYLYNSHTKVWNICSHESLTYPGIVYYKNEEVAKQAFKYLCEHYNNIK